VTEKRGSERVETSNRMTPALHMEGPAPSGDRACLLGMLLCTYVGAVDRRMPNLLDFIDDAWLVLTVRRL
jgi:hypothetical protein